MEVRKDEEESEKGEGLEEEEKEDSQEDEKDPKKTEQNPENYQNKTKNQEDIDEKREPQNEEEDQNFVHTPKKPIENIEEKDQIQEPTPENQDQDQEQDLEATSTYILKYTRKGEELKELAVETGLRKSENCLFMLNIKLIKSDSVSIIDPSEELKDQETPTPKEPENFLAFCCHEIAAIYFDEIYERIYTLKDLAKENKYFKVFESTEEAKIVIDETIRTNEKNAKKIFIGFKDKELKLHMKLSFFDKEKEIVLNIPKKPLSDEDKVNLLPEFLKEIQDKMNHLNEENKKLKIRKNSFGNRNKENRYNYKNNIVNESVEMAKEKKEKNDNLNMNINNTEVQFNQFNEFSKEEINISNNRDINNISNTLDNKANNINSNNNGNNVTHKKVKKLKVIKKKHAKPEENFF